MKKLAAVMIAVATLVAGSIALAQDVPPGAVHGAYELFATGTCSHSAVAFTLNPATKPVDPASAYAVNTNPGTATPNANTWVSSYLGRGTFTFHGDGTGAMRVTQSCILHVGEVTASLDQKIIPPAAVAETFPFAYWLAEDGAITVQIPAVSLWLTGTLSPDHKTMTLASTMQQQEIKNAAGVTYDWQVCTIGRLLFRVGE